MTRRFCRSRCCWQGSVKPSAQPTLVRTQHLPPPANIPPELHKPGSDAILPCATACGARYPYAARCAKYVPKPGGSALDHLLMVLGTGGFFNATFRFVLLPEDALGVDPQQDVHTVAGPSGDLRGWYPGVQPGGDRCMPQIVRALGQ